MFHCGMNVSQWNETQNTVMLHSENVFKAMGENETIVDKSPHFLLDILLELFKALCETEISKYFK